MKSEIKYRQKTMVVLSSVLESFERYNKFYNCSREYSLYFTNIQLLFRKTKKWHEPQTVIFLFP